MSNGPEFNGEMPSEESEESRKARIENLSKELHGCDAFVEELILSQEIQNRYEAEGPDSILPEEKQFMGEKTIRGALFFKNHGRKPTPEEIQKIGEEYLKSQKFFKEMEKDKIR